LAKGETGMAVAAIATLKVREGNDAEFTAAAREMMAAVGANEPGNRLYRFFKSRKDETTYVVLEIYESDEAAKFHTKSDHFRALAPKLGAAMAGPPDVLYLDSI
jgi:quinol monooxygenase YgiN